MNSISTHEKLQIFTKLSQLTQNNYYIFDVEQQRLSWLSKEIAEEMLKIPLEDIIHAEDLEKVKSSFHQAGSMRDEDIVTREFRIIDPAGGYRWTQDRITVYQRNQNGKIKSFIGLATDIHDRKSAEENLQLTVEKLLANAKMAALGEMSGGIAHEINNPLTVIHARAFQLSQMVEHDKIDPEKIKQAAESIGKTADKISKMVNSLRSFAREGRKDPFELAPVKQIVEETLDFCRARFYNNGIAIEVTLPSEELEIECRLIQIEQVLLNLLNNSFDAVRNLNERWIHIVVEEFENDVEFQVIDSGSGVSKEVADNMLAPFFTTKELGKGTGLGLSISNQIIRSHQGTLSLKAEAANTTMVIRIPKWQNPPNN